MDKYSVTVRKVRVYHFDEFSAEDVDHAERLAKELVEDDVRHAFEVTTADDSGRDCSHTQVTVRSVEGVCFLIAREDADGEIERDDFVNMRLARDDFRRRQNMEFPRT
tara:strand:+ start:54 stop:377 length:324 start_codon:yes stop_codon:yes gene_type:complete